MQAALRLPTLPTFAESIGGATAIFERRSAEGRVTDDEARILQDAASGNAEAFRKLFAKHRTDVQRLVFRMVGARSDIDDIVQEVFIQVFRSLRDFRGQAKFSTWLHRVTVNVVLMHRRAAKSRPTYTEEASHDIVADEAQVLPDEDAARRERMRAFGRLLDRLADKKRVVFVLHELEGMSPAEISEIVGAPILTVRTRLFYARRELEQMWKDEPTLASLGATFSKSDGSNSGEEDE
jgi:RNA polymerase sigma-70 factor, ECF subfamily